jgi:16S rRNA (cytosine967-C5)-methyltransferase
MASVAPARSAAYQALRAVLSGKSDLPEALARARVRLEDERDRSLTAEIAAGTIRWLASLDAVIEAFAKRPLARLDAEVLDILRLSAYQLLYLDRIPPSAVVHDAVELVRVQKKQSASGLVNALLRRVDRERHRLPLPPRPDPVAASEAAVASRSPEDESAANAAALDYLSITLSHPRWLAARWLGRVGFEACEAWTRFDNRPAALTLRANTLKTSVSELREALARHGVECESARFAPNGLVVRHGNPLHTPLADAGMFLLQDEASQLVTLAVDARPGERVFDACAAPGGKTVAMAGDMRGEGLLVASDLRPRRLRLLRESVRAAEASQVRIARVDAAGPLPFGPVFDAVLLDAPCSGLGTIRRDPEIRWRRTPEDLERMAATQDRMLDRVAATVKPGGRLVYATCSSEPEENEERISAFLARNPGFRPVNAARQSERTAALGPVVNEAGFLRTWPFQHQLEAFFAAVLVRAPG